MLPTGPRTSSPQAIEAEQKILGSILLEPSLLAQVARTLKPHHFAEPKYSCIYSSMLQLVNMGAHVSAVTLTDFLRQNSLLEKVGGGTGVGDLLGVVATTEPSQIEAYCTMITDRYLQRKMIAFGQELIEASPFTTDPHGLIRASADALAKMNGSVGGGDPRILQASLVGREISTRDTRMPTSIVGNGILCERSLALLYGKPGLGKTWIALQQALAIASGQPWLGIQTVKTRVGFVEMEMDEYYLKQRLLQLVRNDPSLEEGLDNLEFVVRPNYKGAFDLQDNGTRDGVVRWCQDRGLGVLIMDAMSRLHYARENDAQEMGRVLGNVDFIREESGAAIELIHHEPKEGETPLSDLDAARGSSRFQSDPQTMMRLKVFQGHMVLAFAKMNLGPQHETVYLHRLNDGNFEPKQAPESPAAIKERNMIKVEAILLRASSGGTTIQAIAEELGVNKGNLYKYMNDIAVKVGRFYYHKSVAGAQGQLEVKDESPEDRG